MRKAIELIPISSSLLDSLTTSDMRHLAIQENMHLTNECEIMVVLRETHKRSEFFAVSKRNSIVYQRNWMKIKNQFGSGKGKSILLD